MYGLPFFVIIYRSYDLLKTVHFLVNLICILRVSMFSDAALKVVSWRYRSTSRSRLVASWRLTMRRLLRSRCWVHTLSIIVGHCAAPTRFTVNPER